MCNNMVTKLKKHIENETKNENANVISNFENHEPVDYKSFLKSLIEDNPNKLWEFTEENYPEKSQNIYNHIRRLTTNLNDTNIEMKGTIELKTSLSEEKIIEQKSKKLFIFYPMNFIMKKLRNMFMS